MRYKIKVPPTIISLRDSFSRARVLWVVRSPSTEQYTKSNETR